jgi:plastocyanin
MLGVKADCALIRAALSVPDLSKHMANKKGSNNMKKIASMIIGVTLACSAVQTAPAGGIVGTVKANGAKNGGDAVIYIEKVPGVTFPAPVEHAKMDQKNMTFIPHVMPVLVGTTVDFLNSDNVLHNVFSPDKCADKFDLGTWPKGQTKSYTFRDPGCNVTILCNVHPEMRGHIIVLQTPYFGVSAKDGRYAINDVPPGRYTLKIWHEKLKGEDVTIEVTEKQKAIADFEIHK